MTDSNPGWEASGSGRESRWTQYGVLGVACALVVGVYLYTAQSDFLLTTSLNPSDAYYNLLVRGFRAGHLNVEKEAPPGLAQLANPYDRTANIRYGVLDLSYFRGKLYLYFGVTPALLVFWPYVALTGHYLLQKDATLIFCLIGFLASVGLLCALWRRYFANVSSGVLAAGILALGLATFIPFLLGRCEVYEVPLSCGYALTMLALAAIWKALHGSRSRPGWLAAASLAYGLAVGARPSLLFGAVIFLVPVAQASREGRKVWVALMAAVGPLAFIGLGLMLYNALRFENPFDFGWHYQMSGGRQDTIRPFGLQYFWFNFRVLFLEPARWSGRFPYVHDIRPLVPPIGYGGGEHAFGILTTVPLVWLALAASLGWRSRLTEAQSILRMFLAAVALLFGTCALTLCLFRGANARYEMEFVPALVLLAVIGILSLERALALREAGLTPASQLGQACRPGWRTAIRCGWGLLLIFSVAFNLLLSVERVAETHYDLGNVRLQQGKNPEAIAEYEHALRLNPDYPEAHNNLGFVLEKQGQVTEAIAQYEQALEIKPNFAEAYNNLGVAVGRAGRLRQAITCYEQALQIKTDYADAHCNLAGALVQAGDFTGAVRHYEQSLHVNPDSASTHNNLGSVLGQLGQAQQAVSQWEQALQIDPDYAEAHYNLGVVLERAGRVQDAIRQYEQALRTKPDFAEAQQGLVRLQAGQ